MKISEIRDLPTELTQKMMTSPAFLHRQTNAIHESVLRSYHIVEEVKHLLKLNTPQEVILEIIEEIEQ